ncbi:MAG: hypothetical protein BGO90_10270 [Legionella sp. 40-6]|nr:GIY-YIG nuclease family protein [Legionella sp.]OJY42792.1 MAG: hypothetical protein BGO90_10270 [Legionella sp. 40-6]
MTDCYWVYILLCENLSYYTGYTDDLEKRFQTHLSGKGSKYTRSFRPVAIAQSWKVTGDKAAAMRLERYIKSLTRAQKEVLIQNPEQLSYNDSHKPDF